MKRDTKADGSLNSEQSHDPDPKRPRTGVSPSKLEDSEDSPFCGYGPEAEVEHALVTANILHALASPERHLNGIDDSDIGLKYDTFPKPLKEEFDSYEDLPNDPKTNDYDKDIPSHAKSMNLLLQNGDDEDIPPVLRIFSIFKKSVPPSVGGRSAAEAERHPPLFSDGVESTHPSNLSKSVVFCDYDSSDEDAALLGASWLAKLGLYFGWPDGYRLVSIATAPATGVRWDAYLFGHISGKRFRSPNEFLPHLHWLCNGDPKQPCLCKICNGALVADDSHIKFINYLPSKSLNEQSVAAYDTNADPVTDENLELENALLEPPVAVESGADLADLPGVHPSAISNPPVEIPGRNIDDDWNDSNYNSESDADYCSSGSGANSDAESETSSDVDSMNDDDDDDSGNESGETTGQACGSHFGNEIRQLFPDLPDKKIETVDDLDVLPASTLMSWYAPCRKGEVAWYPSSQLNCRLWPKDSRQFPQHMTFWPCLVLCVPSSTSVTIIPLPLPTPSELMAALNPSPEFASLGAILPRNIIRTLKTPGHYTPRPTHAPVFTPCTVPLSHLVPWRQIEPSPPVHPKKNVSGEKHWQRRWNRGVIQAVGVSSTWEPIPDPSNPYDDSSVDELGTVWQELKAVRWGVEVIRVNDWTHVVLPSPCVERRDGRYGISERTLASAKHRLMRISRIVFRSPTTSKSFGDRDVETAKKLIAARRKSAKVIVEGDVYAYRKGTGWIYVGVKRCTMKKVVIGRRFGHPPVSEEGPQENSSISQNSELEEVGLGFGQVGLIAAESRGVWEGWLKLDSENSKSSPSAFLDMVNGLEIINETTPVDGFDFNYSEDEGSDDDDDE
ncbi:hypothetical protein HDU82_007732 [Entophlyctis luteolus]|nr:hypothetical protein HDU82_007732 [Entophlyctis luteolus]